MAVRKDLTHPPEHLKSADEGNKPPAGRFPSFPSPPSRKHGELAVQAPRKMDAGYLQRAWSVLAGPPWTPHRRSRPPA
ncbi:uncharacterized protein TrAtP1_003698 [Trichoderma atroviride]|uniref:uncharacterized protein n=1 Tax=Hypocrea atroviridis TaxID=63577 RepID=UPI00331BFD95|nr:hypothetical protein TrAtP1_003698 [Trichoderma atroviride]